MTMDNVLDVFENCDSLNTLDIKDLLDAEEGYAHIVAKNSTRLNPTQLRKYFGVLKKMDQKETWTEIETDFYLLKPRMAMAVARKNLTNDFYKVILAAMSKIDNVEDDELKMKNFNIFVMFFEAVIAYHKFEDTIEKNINDNKG